MDKLDQAKKNFEEGIKFFKKKDFTQAQIYFEKTLEVAPNSSPTMENLSKSYLETGDYDKAEKVLKYFISLNKEDDQIAYKLLYEIYSILNKYDELRNLSKIAIKKNKFDSAFNLKSRLFYPSYFNSKEEINEVREKFTNEVETMLYDKNLPTLDLSKNLIKPPNFELLFDDVDNLEINKKLVKLYKKIYPELSEFSSFSVQKNEKIKIGFISQFFTDHSIMKIYKGIIYKLNKDIFDVFVFHSDRTLPGKSFTEINESVVSYNFENIILPKNFHDKVKVIREKSLDILFYPDIPLSTNLFYLSFVKLAKFHVTSIGHADTTGNSNIDFFISAKLMEAEGYQNRYSEKVLLTKYLPMYYYRPKISFDLKKEDLIKRNIYSCPQNLVKMHPDFDVVLKKILQKDKKAKIILIKDRKEVLSKFIFDRLNKIVPEHMDRVEFINRLTAENFIQHCGMASIILSPFSVGSGNTFIDSMYYGTPTITKPTNYSKSLVVAAAYKQMEIVDPPIVNNIDDYVDRAIDIANNINLELKMYYKEQANKHLYENLGAIKELENIFKSIVK